MRNALLVLVVSTVLPGLVATACKKKEEEPPPQQGYSPYPGYGAAGGQGGGYGAQPGGYSGAAPTATSTGTMSTPAPMAFPCQSDAQCLTHRCNTAVGRCAWPCQSAADCAPGNTCMPPACVPSMGGAAPAPTQ